MESPSNGAIASYKKLLATTASVAASTMLARSIVNDLLPGELRGYVSSCIDAIWGRLRPERHTIIIDKKAGYETNVIYDAASIYLSTRLDCKVRRLRASKVEGEEAMVVSLDYGEEMVDVYQGVEFWWRLVFEEKDDLSESRKRNSFEISFDVKHADMAMHSYFLREHVI